jgi:DNA-directed RNA polymerase subunit RPC12/RpoP
MMNTTKQQTKLAQLHRATNFNSFEISYSNRCACFNCGQSFAPAQITEWTDKDMTALCPHCHMDSVVPSYNGNPTDSESLAELKRYAY